MLRSKVLIVLFIVTFGAIASFVVAEGRRPKNKKANAPNEFAGKVVSISIKSSPTRGTAMQNVSIRILGRHQFLVGTAIDSGHPGDWVKGRKVWIDLDNIALIVEFPSVEEFKKAGTNTLTPKTRP